MAFDEVTSTPRWSPDSHYAKEMRKWEKPYKFERFPAMLYKARKKNGMGPFLCVDPYDESFSTQNQRTVGNPQEEESAIRDGWRQSPDEAVSYVKGLEDDIAKAASERAFSDRKLSDKAQAEAKAADEATDEHLAEIPQKRLGRPRKAVPAA